MGKVAEREGFERSLLSAQVTDCQKATSSAEPLRTQLGSQSAGAQCPLLAKVVAAWSNLPATLRAAIAGVATLHATHGRRSDFISQSTPSGEPKLFEPRE